MARRLAGSVRSSITRMPTISSSKIATITISTLVLLLKKPGEVGVVWLPVPLPGFWPWAVGEAGAVVGWATVAVGEGALLTVPTAVGVPLGTTCTSAEALKGV